VSALIFRGQGLQLAVVDSDNKVKLTTVTLGRDFGTDVEVVTGLTGEMNLIINPPDSVVDGEQVQIVPNPATQQKAASK
jgi:hypothetical protein